MPHNQAARRPKVTILNAVPPTDTWEPLTTGHSFKTAALPTGDGSSFRSKSITSSLQESASHFNVRRDVSDSPAPGLSSQDRFRSNRIGLWVNGNAVWDDEVGVAASEKDAPSRIEVELRPSLTRVDSHSGPAVEELKSSKHTSPRAHLNLAQPVPIIKHPQPRRPMGPRPDVKGGLGSSPSTSSTARAWNVTLETTNRSAYKVEPLRYPIHSLAFTEIASRSSHSSSRGTVSSQSGSVFSREDSVASTATPTDYPLADHHPDIMDNISKSHRPGHVSFNLGPDGDTAHNTRSPRHLQLPGTLLPSTTSMDWHTPSPTLSQAEYDLHAHLASMAEYERCSQVLRAVRMNLHDRESDAIDGAEEVQQVPAIPKKSRKREWLQDQRLQKVKAVRSAPSLAGNVSKPLITDTATDARILRRCNSMDCSPRLESLPHPEDLSPVRRASVPDTPTHVATASINSGTTGRRRGTEPENHHLTTSSAKDVVLSLLSSLSTLQDLSNLTRVNKDMYNIFKQNRDHVIQAVLSRQTPPAWEHLEWEHMPVQAAKAAHPVSSEKAASSYAHSLIRDRTVIKELKQLMSERCSTIIRKATHLAIADASHPDSQRFDDALWRIWTFCHIFGNNKGREDDITGQLDWLKGGLLAYHQACDATVNANLDNDAASILLNTPSHFAHGNPGGLSALQLFDMTELWTCLRALLQDYHAHPALARSHGVFANTPLPSPDAAREAFILEEWTAYLLTLGPAVILLMARHAATNTHAQGFALAQSHGWTTWSLPLYDGSRNHFLREPLARSYEERIRAAALDASDPARAEQRRRSRQRVATLAAEIRLRRQASSYARLPLISMQHERAMSVSSVHSPCTPALTSHPSCASTTITTPTTPCASPSCGFSSPPFTPLSVHQNFTTANLAAIAR